MEQKKESRIGKGRVKGSKNKQKQTFEEIVQLFRDRKVRKAFAAWENIKDEKDKVKTYIDLAKLITPSPTVTVDAQISSKGYADVLRNLRKETEARADNRED